MYFSKRFPASEIFVKLEFIFIFFKGFPWRKSCVKIGARNFALQSWMNRRSKYVMWNIHICLFFKQNYSLGSYSDKLRSPGATTSSRIFSLTTIEWELFPFSSVFLFFPATSLCSFELLLWFRRLSFWIMESLIEPFRCACSS